MSPNEAELVVRQRQLLIRSTRLRLALAEQSQILVGPLTVADRVVATARWLYLRRGWIAAGALVVVLLRPQRALRLLSKCWWVWRAARRVSPWLLVAAETYGAGSAWRRARGRVT
jgi:YqjK-like protein